MNPKIGTYRRIRKKLRSGSDILAEMAEIEITGNIIPNRWYSIIVRATKKGLVKADLLAINILADVVFWYRLKEVRDEETGEHLGYEKRFKADKLQVNYAKMAMRFGSTKVACKRACDLLEHLGAIHRDFRDITLANGDKMFNVLFVEPAPSWIRANSHSLRKSKGVLTKKERAPYEIVKTNTQSTTQSPIEEEGVSGNEREYDYNLINKSKKQMIEDAANELVSGGTQLDKGWDQWEKEVSIHLKQQGCLYSARQLYQKNLQAASLAAKTDISPNGKTAA